MATSKLSTLVKSLDFKTNEEYFDYIIQSNFNGQFSQTRKLYKDMRLNDRTSFFTYVRECTDLATYKSILDTLSR